MLERRGHRLELGPLGCAVPTRDTADPAHGDANYRPSVELHSQELWQLTGLLVGMAALLVLASFFSIPYPILLVLGGLALGFIPGLPDFELPPELVLIAFLPPLLYASAFFTSLRDLRANVRPISLLAIVLVAATMVGVAVVAHALIDEITWPAAFVLGAVVSPTDPLAATTIARRLGIPRRMVTVIEGESLVNDATALVFYRTAVVATVTGAFSLWESGGRLVLNAVAGVAIGLVVGYVIRQIRRRIDHAPTEITLALLTGYLAYLPAEALGVSAVLAAVTAGIYLGWYTPELTTTDTRLQGEGFWRILVFVMNAVLFTLIGLQLPQILDGLAGWSASEVAVAAVAVCATVVLIRLVLVFPFAYVPRYLSARIRARDPYPPWSVPFVLGWSGMRGAVSLAAALAIPLETDAGAPFPARELIIFLTFCVILFTLVVQGLSLPYVIGRLGLEDDGLEAQEDARARKRAAMAALERIDELEGEGWAREDTLERSRGLYRFRIERFGERLGHGDGSVEERSGAYQRLRRDLLHAEEQAVLQMRNDGEISDAVMNRVLRDIALEDARLDR
jgi:CPA1 family monovalent cation:H+ antiporter